MCSPGACPGEVVGVLCARRLCQFVGSARAHLGDFVGVARSSSDDLCSYCIRDPMMIWSPSLLIAGVELQIPMICGIAS
ncbi:MAG: hypothetical protein JNJ88_07275 [Planctomycetes bacterium]|nr:hypothetical protein [Planctomycetota bacterium]